MMKEKVMFNDTTSRVAEGEHRSPKIFCGKRRSPNILWGTVFPQTISGQGERWYSSIPPSRLAKKCKVYGIWILRKI